MNLEQRIKDKGYASINDFARQNKINASTVYYWCKQGEKLGYNKKKQIDEMLG